MNSDATVLAWFKSSHSGSEGDDCVEIAITDHAVHVRDSKDLTRPAFTVSRDGWTRFVQSASGR